MPFAIRRGVRLYWELTGNEAGPPLLLIRGLSRSSRYWYDIRPLLEPRFRVLVLDNRGVGRSDAPVPGFTTADMADDVAAVLAASGVHRANVFGLSLGGMIAQQLVLRHPGRVERLVLGATTMGGSGAHRTPSDAILGFLRTANVSVADQIRLTMKWAIDPDALARRPEILDEWIAIAESEPRNRLSLAGQLLAAGMHDTSEHLHRVRAPTMVVVGDRDRLIPPMNSHRIARTIPRARLEVLHGAGHDFTTERPAEVAALVSEFFAPS
ncbi:alpha/beta fold hydrolase [Sandaracinus amylolyticus]|uniref:alpha/beta fold hydrolase n=1 Tax=Sandaracinus amylolyticus TaxID=927083 RepID=UPI001F434C11|nr:alpha/beta hydrolase [Sandaracinus amylolyticus]UJR78488.1 Beta-ketoadipate enol-lactone hydrolase [Sandaracinus amylolyticus]